MRQPWSGTRELNDPIYNAEDELNQALDSVLESALENGINVLGSYVSRNGPEHPDVEVVVYELAKSEQGD